jgi:hypothetical protein
MSGISSLALVTKFHDMLVRQQTDLNDDIAMAQLCSRSSTPMHVCPLVGPIPTDETLFESYLDTLRGIAATMKLIRDDIYVIKTRDAMARSSPYL